MKNLLFYGDSNTWGFNPATGERYPYEKRWTTICAETLGSGYYCVSAGMNGRTTKFDDPVKGCRNGLTAIDYELQTHKPLDLIVVMLGTNDLKYTDAEDSAGGLEELIRMIFTANERFSLSSPVFPEGAKLLLISPVQVSNSEWFDTSFDAQSESLRFAGLYRSAAERALWEVKTQCRKRPELFFLDAALYAKPSVTDGVHLGEDGHQALGDAIAQKIRDIMGEV